MKQTPIYLSLINLLFSLQSSFASEAADRIRNLQALNPGVNPYQQYVVGAPGLPPCDDLRLMQQFEENDTAPAGAARVTKCFETIVPVGADKHSPTCSLLLTSARIVKEFCEKQLTEGQKSSQLKQCECRCTAAYSMSDYPFSEFELEKDKTKGDLGNYRPSMKNWVIGSANWGNSAATTKEILKNVARGAVPVEEKVEKGWARNYRDYERRMAPVGIACSESNSIPPSFMDPLEGKACVGYSHSLARKLAAVTANEMLSKNQSVSRDAVAAAIQKKFESMEGASGKYHCLPGNVSVKKDANGKYPEVAVENGIFGEVWGEGCTIEHFDNNAQNLKPKLPDVPPAPSAKGYYATGTIAYECLSKRLDAVIKWAQNARVKSEGENTSACLTNSWEFLKSYPFPIWTGVRTVPQTAVELSASKFSQEIGKRIEAICGGIQGSLYAADADARNTAYQASQIPADIPQQRAFIPYKKKDSSGSHK